MQVSGVIACCDRTQLHHIGGVNTYRIILAGDGFQIIETYPDGRRSYIGGFSTEAAAQAWLENYLRMRRQNDGPLGKPSEPET